MRLPQSDGVRVLGFFLGRLTGHQAFLHQALQALVQGLHAQGAAGLDGGVHLRHLVLPDQVPDRRGADHDLVGGDPPAAVFLHQVCEIACSDSESMERTMFSSAGNTSMMRSMVLAADVVPTCRTRCRFLPR